MLFLTKKQERTLEFALVIVVVGLADLLYHDRDQNMVVLNLFYLPIALGAVVLGRYRAGVLTLFSVLAAVAVSIIKLESSSTFTSPLVTALALTFWAAVMGLNALLIGTLSDERLVNLRDLHDAHVGVVEVLSHYLTRADARIQDRTQRVADLSQRVAVEMNLPSEDVDDIRVAALLQEMGSFEVTAKVIRRAVDNISRDPQRNYGEHTFCGSDFAQSLGGVLTGALGLMGHQPDPWRLPGESESDASSADRPLGAKILQTVREYDRLAQDKIGATGEDHTLETLRELQSDVDAQHDPAVLLALERVELQHKPAGTYSARLETALKRRQRFGLPS